MKQTLLSFKRVLDTLLEWLVILVVMLMVVDVLWGVFTRFILNSPSQLTEEIARLLLMWVALLGAAVAYGRSEHLGFDYLVAQLDPAVKKLLALVSQCIVVAFALLVMVYGGFILVSETLAANQVTPALHLKMGYVYLALPVSGLFMSIYGVEQFLETAIDDGVSLKLDTDPAVD
ncbi:TRAP transporter small permease [Bythopirellula polymerisocia]|uniref:2,3-diketo-L-gulonate TRAP transporter small permease protein YiaM n=1 Tax=Bythopirellula polymerisocia TaxID=2528003 RepID=A0A5C6D151_9BACT|nr:TRAP transporter small permease [Bythopirellula polymerisocia]TWU30458.1 2,3-diketo-L-gulonate TRAP transporter small permease protein YiaM [Bythopirellula polymerisocia]